MSNDMIPKEQEELRKEELKKQFEADNTVIAEQTVSFVETMHPAYCVKHEEVKKLAYKDSNEILDAFTFYRLVSCTTEDVDDLYTFLNERMMKFCSAIWSIGESILYGVVSYQGFTNLVIGIHDTSDKAERMKSVMEGLLDGIELHPYKPSFSERPDSTKEVGFISAVPSVKISEEKQKFDISSLMKCLNGQDYTIFFAAKPLSQKKIVSKYDQIMGIRDACFAVSKRNISRQQGTSHSEGEMKGNGFADTHSEGITKTFGFSAGLPVIKGLSLGASFGIGKTVMDAHTVTENYSKSVSDALNRNDSISAEIQNGFALEMIKYANKAIERLCQGKNNGMWETVISYSADSETTAGIIRACITGELAKPDPDILPLVSQAVSAQEETAQEETAQEETAQEETSQEEDKCQKISMILPENLIGEGSSSRLCTALTSAELGMMCSIPTESVPNFELKKGKVYPMVSERVGGAVTLGLLTEGNRQIKHMPFALSHEDLARHTFVCGITGSGKTTTVKRILRDADTPFLVIESAKAEYRNIKLSDGTHPDVYTLGKPEINCIQINPFYIPCGVTPQTHIDFLKDLFNASFSFYGPMPYILEKCLHTIYQKKGWNLTLGCHPYLADIKNTAQLFDAGHMQEPYAKKAHKFLFPTMQDLKNEIKRYIEQELQYEGEVAGNVKTAILARLESLCSGVKGYMFNTYEFVDMGDLLAKNTVFELEGLADDDDKAFCVGLLIIFVNEYRQATKETSTPQHSLSHLLVVEEAHRLLKNVDTERSTEETGNPKGKAVEHFTNMIAEMRSYGQGVIIAEQIPTKLVPDVIKNSSNKIIQRLVAADDQNIVANTIGLNDKEAIYIGNLAVGRALCHKEGMSLPVNVAIQPIEENRVTNAELKLKGDMNVRWINTSMMKECIADDMDLLALKMLNSILIQDYALVEKSIVQFRKKVQSNARKKHVELIPGDDENAIYSDLLSEAIVRYLLNGAYSISIKELVSDELVDVLRELLYTPKQDALDKVREALKKAYMGETPEYKGKYVICHIVYNQMKDGNTDLEGTIKNNFIVSDDSDKTIIQDIMKMISDFQSGNAGSIF